MKKKIIVLFGIATTFICNYVIAQPPIRGTISAIAKPYRLDKILNIAKLINNLSLEPECVLVDGRAGRPPRPTKVKNGTFRFKITQNIPNYYLEVMSSLNQDVLDILSGSFTSPHDLPCFIRMVDKSTGAVIYYSINGEFPTTQKDGYNLKYTVSPLVCK